MARKQLSTTRNGISKSNRARIRAAIVNMGPPVAGYQGSVTLPNSKVAKLNNIVFNRTQELGDTSGWGDSGERSRISLLKDLTGSASGFVTIGSGDDAGFQDVGGSVPGNMVIALTPTYTLTFPCLLSAVRVGNAYAGYATITFDWAKSAYAAGMVAGPP